MILKQLGTLDYELHMDLGKTKLVLYNRLKPYHSLKRQYYHALAEAKRNAPQPHIPVSSWDRD